MPGDEEAADDNDPLVQEITSMFKNVKPEVLEFATSIMRSAVDELQALNLQQEELKMDVP